MTGSASGATSGRGGSALRAVSTSTTTSGSGSGSTSTACAACKYQRRKCTPDCPLSPYFPPDQPKRFQNVHKLFGVSNILRILKHVDPSKREDTVKSIAYEADTREKDPVHGCLGVITILQNQVSKLKDELAVARDQLFLLQQQHNFNQQAQMQQIVGSLGGSTSIVNVSSAPGQAETNNVLMQNFQSYNDMNLTADFAKSNPLPIASFEPDQYLRNDGFDQVKPDRGAASTSKFDVGRYNIRGESPELHHQSALLGRRRSVKLEEQRDHHLHRHNSGMHYGMTTTDSVAAGSTTLESSAAGDIHNQQLLQDGDQHRFAMAIRRRGSSGILNLTVASEADLRIRAAGGHHGVIPEHELRSAGVYLTLTNN